jgi:hypothetical protein
VNNYLAAFPKYLWLNVDDNNPDSEQKAVYATKTEKSVICKITNGILLNLLSLLKSGIN